MFSFNQYKQPGIVVGVHAQVSYNVNVRIVRRDKYSTPEPLHEITTGPKPCLKPGP